MTPAARLQAAIEILDRIDASPPPADAVVDAELRSRRYAGSKDRRAITERIWSVLRRRARLAWHAAPGIDDPRAVDARSLILAALAADDRMSLEAIEALFSGAGHGPAPLTPDERARLLRPPPERTAPDWVMGEYPAWLGPSLSRAFGADHGAEAEALATPAPLDLRVNTLKADRAAARARLAEEGIATEPTPHSPLGLRVEGRPALTTSDAYREGLVEIQDEASQVAALSLEAQPGETILDLCAGAGGKALALAAIIGDRGRIVACDIDRGRLARLAPRLARSGTRCIETRLIRDGEPPVEEFDRVLVDAPCSGTGTWRRDPDSRWRLTPEALANLTALQDRLLDHAADRVRPGGLLVYVTCSLLAEENEDRSAAFVARHPDFLSEPGPYPARLSPRRTGTDGFGIARFRRVPTEGPMPTAG